MCCEKGSLPYRQCVFSECFYRYSTFPVDYFTHLQEGKEEFLSTADYDEKLCHLADAYYVVRNYVMYFILRAAWCKNKYGIVEQRMFEYDAGENPVLGSREKNMGYLLSVLVDEAAGTFLLTDDGVEDHTDIQILKRVFSCLGKNIVYVSDFPLQMSEPMTMAEAIQYSIGQAAEHDGCIEVRSVVFEDAVSGTGKSNYAELILFMANNLDQKDAMLLFATDGQLNRLLENKDTARYMQRLSDCRPAHFSYQMGFAWAGDYTKYMSRIYGFSVKERISRPASCEFSIVIPVRNNAETLGPTLETCLNQRYQGTYEIVISDNSDPDNSAIYALCQRYADEHIHYYRTPHVLTLCKSFEYAFLQARGEFIFSIGADDGLFPWTLQILEAILPQMGEHDLLQWRRCFYAWPGFNHGQQHQLEFPINHTKGKVELTEIPQRVTIADRIASSGDNIYALVLLYINSGFRRSFFCRLLKQTGRLWDGPCQDVYMGAVNLAINESVLYTDYPLTIAGMSSSSVGAAAGKVDDSLTAAGQRILQKKVVGADDWLCGYTLTRQEYLFPYIERMDIVVFFWPILKLFAQGFIQEKELLSLDWPMFYRKLVSNIDSEDVFVDRTFEWLNYSIHLLDKWQSRESTALDYELMDRRGQEEDVYLKRAYAIGVTADRTAIVTDGSLFGIHNIKDAAVFVENLCGL